MSDGVASVEDVHDDVLSQYQHVLKKFKDIKSVAVTETRFSDFRSPEESIETTEMNERIASFRTALNVSLDAISENYVLLTQSCRELEDRVRLLRAELHELHQIEVEQNTLSSLVDRHEQRKRICEQEYQSFLNQFEAEKKQKRQEWREEEERHRYERDALKEKERVSFELEKREFEQLLSTERYEVQLLKKELELKDQIISTLESRIMRFDALKSSLNRLISEKEE